MKTKSYIKNEILRLTGDWSRSIIDRMVNEALEILDNGKATTIDQAISKTIDSYY